MRTRSKAPSQRLQSISHMPHFLQAHAAAPVSCDVAKALTAKVMGMHTYETLNGRPAAS